MGEGDTAHDNI